MSGNATNRLSEMEIRQLTYLSYLFRVVLHYFSYIRYLVCTFATLQSS